MLPLAWQQLLQLLGLRWPAKRHPDEEKVRMPSLSQAIFHWLQLWWAVNPSRHLISLCAPLLPTSPSRHPGNPIPAPLVRDQGHKLPYDAFPLSCCLLN